MGLFAREPIPRQTLLGISHVQHDLFEHGWIRTPLGGFYNHSEESNCYLFSSMLSDGTRIQELITKTNIPIGTELTCTYTIWQATEEMKKSNKKIECL
tara:strand:+ start:110 stop:403 length:294 start_codon:yes stop_codon:yes gene_type:complete